jgi:ParB-like chromosome segregation protein Spo0J
MNKENHVNNLITALLAQAVDMNEKVYLINSIREHIHSLSPFQTEPVDFVRWVLNTEVVANDYNPNSVAPPEMKLLEISITSDGYTQPIVTFPRANKIEVVDGFHRHRVGKECKAIQSKIHGYLPVVSIRKEGESINDRMASTIRHNRARGKHSVDSMSEIVMELKRRMWNDEKIARELGMETDEVLRLSQISGLSEVFNTEGFSEAWDFETEEEIDETIL